MNVPCHGCGDRQIGCHSSCERYAEYTNKLIAIRKQKWFEKSVDELNYLAKAKTLKEKNWRESHGSRK